MTKTFTPDDLLRYLYKDTSPVESKEIEKALNTDERLHEKWQHLKADMQMLDSLFLKPSEAATDRIMQWAGAMSMAALRN